MARSTQASTSRLEIASTALDRVSSLRGEDAELGAHARSLLVVVVRHEDAPIGWITATDKLVYDEHSSSPAACQAHSDAEGFAVRRRPL
jgi:hypothetical protein